MQQSIVGATYCCFEVLEGRDCMLGLQTWLCSRDMHVVEVVVYSLRPFIFTWLSFLS